MKMSNEKQEKNCYITPIYEIIFFFFFFFFFIVDQNVYILYGDKMSHVRNTSFPTWKKLLYKKHQSLGNETLRKFTRVLHLSSH